MEPCKTLGQHHMRHLTQGYCGCGYLKDLHPDTQQHETIPETMSNITNAQPTALPKPSQPAASRTRG